MKLVAWDFDGVLNKGYQGGFFLWQESFEADLGVSAEVFTEFMFGSNQFDAVLTGKRDLLHLLSEWTRAHAPALQPEAVLDYWLAKDAHPDPQVLGWLDACGLPGVIATNNEAHRARYIWETMGFQTRLQKIFASGPLGVKKPAPGFFEAIEAWSGHAPHDIMLIDDAEKNIRAAAARGWQTFHFTDETREDLPQVLGVTR
ncbi:HAD-IA family hydrolase [bacterium]|nr:HAD-IA family hydrolase [bacterium]